MDNVNHPSHYEQAKVQVTLDVEPLDIIQSLSFVKGNALKYLIRYKHKNGLEDLKKSEFYINKDYKAVKLSNLEMQVTIAYLLTLLAQNKITQEEVECAKHILFNPEQAKKDISNIIKNYGTPLEKAVKQPNFLFKSAIIDNNSLNMIELLNVIYSKSKPQFRNKLNEAIRNSDNDVLRLIKVKDMLLSFLDLYRKEDPYANKAFMILKGTSVVVLQELLWFSIQS